MGLQSGVVWRVGRVWVWRVWVLRVCLGVVDSLGHVEHQSTAHLWIERFCNIEDIEDIENIMSIEDIEGIEDIEDIEDIEHVQVQTNMITRTET